MPSYPIQSLYVCLLGSCLFYYFIGVRLAHLLCAALAASALALEPEDEEGGIVQDELEEARAR